MPGFLFHFPFATAALLIIGGLGCYSIIGLAITRRWILHRMQVRPDLWFIINFGACISLAAAFVFKVRDVRLHAIQVLPLAVFVGLAISMIPALDRPFPGDRGIGPEPYQVVRDQLMKP